MSGQPFNSPAEAIAYLKSKGVTAEDVAAYLRARDQPEPVCPCDADMPCSTHPRDIHEESTR